MIEDLSRYPSARARVAGVIGWPVDHSWSPLIHGYWLEHLRIDGVYVPLPVAPGSLRAAVSGLAAAGLRGFNLTIPYKQQVVPLLDRLTDEAKAIGAVNTVTVASDGALEGHNTDSFGFKEHVVASYPQDVRWLTERPRVVIGAGGAARAVVSGLLDLGTGELRIIGRSRAKVENMIADLRVSRAGNQHVKCVDWAEAGQALDDAVLLVNTTPLGMSGWPSLDLSLKQLPVDAIVADVVYVPLLTPLLRDAGNRGNPTLDGLGMLLHQAVPGFEAWFGTRPQVTTELRDFVIGMAQQS